MAQPPTKLVTVNVTQGALRGKKGKTLLGKPLISFQGIPYAKPPVGPLRFKPPEPADPWDDIRDATEEGSVCFQFDPETKEYVGSEDCLFLNVYTSKLPAERSGALRPVMVWIHGGGFAEGSGNSDRYGPDYLVDEGIVLVTFNYRLGVLGFLSLEDEHVPGNMGLKDQVLALKWVQENISSFGGNPKEVTIFGESAGGASVHLHVLSSMSRGLFHRAIVQSGSAINRWTLARYPRQRACRLATAMGCQTDVTKDLVEFLRKAEPRQMLEAFDKAKNEEEKRKGITYLFIPCVEPELGDEEKFLAKDPVTLLEDGKFNKVPLVIGVSSHEGILMLPNVIKDPNILEKLEKNFDVLIPPNLQTGKLTTQQLSVRIKEFYFGSESISEETIDKYVDLITDLYFILDCHKTVKLHLTAAPEVPVYFYKFSFDGRLNFYKNRILKGKYEVKGASHADELGYLFHQEYVGLDLPAKSPEKLVLRRMVKMWANFAKTGNPTPRRDRDVRVKWLPCTGSSSNYLNIDEELTCETDFLKERMDFWEKLYDEHKS